MAAAPEIVDAARALVEQVKAGLSHPRDITEESFLFSKSHAPDLPDLDLLMPHGGGDMRVSNFLLFGRLSVCISG